MLSTLTVAVLHLLLVSLGLSVDLEIGLRAQRIRGRCAFGCIEGRQVNDLAIVQGLVGTKGIAPR